MLNHAKKRILLTSFLLSELNYLLQFALRYPVYCCSNAQSLYYFVSTLANELYGQTVWKNWKDYYSMHLLSRHRNYLISQDVEESGILEFNEKNIQNYTKPFGEIARSIWNKVEVKKYL